MVCCLLRVQAPLTTHDIVRLRPFCILFFVCATFVGSGHNPSFISVHPCCSAQNSHDHHFMHIWTSLLEVHVFCCLVTLSRPYLGHFKTTSSGCNLPERPGPLHFFPLTCHHWCISAPIYITASCCIATCIGPGHHCLWPRTCFHFHIFHLWT